MTDNEEKKEYLNGYKKSCNKLKSLEEQLQSLTEVSRSAKAQSISDMPKGNKQTDLSDIMVKEEVLFTKIIRLKGECQCLRLDIENGIADMTDGIESMILHKRYIEFKEWEEICVDINYSWKHTHRKHSNALQHFVMPIKNDIE